MERVTATPLFTSSEYPDTVPEYPESMETDGASRGGHALPPCAQQTHGQAEKLVDTFVLADLEKEVEEEEGGGDSTRHWSSKREYLLSTVGFCVGIGNLFRFPYLCNKNGGGAFLIPFLISLMLIGLPLFALEVALGQFSGRNAQQVWAICPLFTGAGVGMVVLSTLCFWYYNTILAWALYYLASSFHASLPWATCDGWWNTPHCFTYSRLLAANGTAANGSQLSSLSGNGTGRVTNFTQTDDVFSDDNVTKSPPSVTEGKLVSAAEEFWQHNVLQISSGLEEPGEVVWYLALTLCITLFICFLALYKGIHSSGKVAYVTATAPYILVTVLLIRGATLPGAAEGIIFYLRPDFTKLVDPQVWVEAALQVFYSLGPGWGGLIVMASYNKFDNNCLRDSVILTLVSEGTSIYGGFAIFSVLGYMAHVSEQDVHSVVSGGPGLAFIVYPEAISLLPLPQVWAVLFFLMVVTLALDSQMTMAEVGLATLMDRFPRQLQGRRVYVTAIFCFVCGLLSLPFVTQGGIFFYQLVDWFLVVLGLVVIPFIECIVVGWIYGVERFGEDIRLMVGRPPPFILTVFWRFITPSLLAVLLVLTFRNFSPPTYGDYDYGTGGEVLGWAVALLSFLPLPVLAVYQLLGARGTLTQRLRQTLKPNSSVWRPADPSARLTYKAMMQREGQAAPIV